MKRRSLCSRFYKSMIFHRVFKKFAYLLRRKNVNQSQKLLANEWQNNRRKNMFILVLRDLCISRKTLFEQFGFKKSDVKALTYWKIVREARGFLRFKKYANHCKFRRKMKLNASLGRKFSPSTVAVKIFLQDYLCFKYR